MSETADADDSTDGHDEIEVIEVVTAEVDSEGNTIVDASVFVVDHDGTVVATDEAISFESPAGDVITSHLGDDGEMHLTDPE